MPDKGDMEMYEQMMIKLDMRESGNLQILFTYKISENINYNNTCPMVYFHPILNNTMLEHGFIRVAGKVGN